jgi:hypothetical protein
MSREEVLTLHPVKRKHITQNRDIIKTNALAQLRIKELEEKVLQLEGERAEKNLEVIRIRANMDRAERATRSVVKGWELVGAGLAAMAAIDGLRVAESSNRADLEAREMLNAPQYKQSSRIVLDPHALPGGVARSVARAPEVQLDNLMEEDSKDLKGDDSEEGISTIEVEETVILLEDVTASQASERTVVQEAYVDHNHTMNKQEEWERDATASPLNDRKASTSDLQYTHPSQPDWKESASRLQRAASTESLSSFADDEEVQLSDDMDDEGEEDILQSILRDQKRAAMQEQRPVKARRKRGPTLSPDISDSVSRSQESGNLSSSDGELPQSTRSSRRSSARDRKSINYALPKLNTKMRKPDPADLIPAQSGERRKGDSEQDVEGDSIREATPKRTLKGGSEVASSGNLRELRKQHQSSRIDAEEAGQQQSDTSARLNAPTTRRRSSTGPQPRRSTSTEDSTFDLGNQRRRAGSDDEEMADLSSSWSNGTSNLNWKPPSSLTSNKSAANGTPIPRNQSGQNIKALKVANRIQKATVNQPSFNGDPRKTVNGSRPFAPTSNAKVLTSSTKSNQVKTFTPNHEKRNSLHAAMTWESQNETNGFGAS